MLERANSQVLTVEEAHAITGLRLLIARAANADSLAWWDDESLTPHATFLLDRLFPVAPPLAARSLALTAAMARHRAVMPEGMSALHLFRLDGDGLDSLAMRQVALLDIPFPTAPIPDIESLRRRLLELTGASIAYTVRRRSEARPLYIDIPPAPRGASPLLRRAQALAWAYLEGAPRVPVFPFCSECRY